MNSMAPLGNQVFIEHRVLILFKRYFLHIKCDAAFERARLEFAS